MKEKVCLKLKKEFEKLYGKGDVSFAFVPCRINIIGEHIDYVEYLKVSVLPFGSKEHYMIMAFRKRDDRKIRCATLSDFKKEEFSLNDFKPPKTKEKDKRWDKYLSIVKPHWSNYIKASVYYLQNMDLEKKLKGMDILVSSNIPIAGGASSSSALVVSTALCIRKVNDIKMNLDEIAESSSKAEWYCGTRGGKMDHASLCFAEEGKVLFITFHPFSVEKISVPEGYSFVTFYTTPANKGKELTAEYNERSIVSRHIIPRLLKEMEVDDLPEEMTLREFGNMFKSAFQDLKSIYPILFKVRGVDYPFKIKDRARHHFAEIDRVEKSKEILQRAFLKQQEKDSLSELSLMKELGQIITESHNSLRDLYDISTIDVEKVVRLALSVKGVLGARIMGGGFGGNVLVLVKKDRVPVLINKIKKDYKKDSTVMISTPGKGAHIFDINLDLIEKVNDWMNWDDNIMSMISNKAKPVKPIIIAGGKGIRATRSGLLGSKVLAKLASKHCIEHVIGKFKEKPIIVVSPDNQNQIKKALKGYDVDYVVQERALGTADAVFRAMQETDFDGDIAVIWGKQALVRKESIKKTILLHQALDSCMSFPTTKRDNPYAPLKRDEDNFVSDSVETHLEGAKKIKFGEDNVGFFVLKSSVLRETLNKLYNEYYIEDELKYRTPKGELGFPNLMIRTLVKEKKPVFGFCFASDFEAIGLNEKKHIEIMEKYLYG